ncbi:MAG TPA: chemotaxis protein CheV, partial [Syntrophobacteraceae bacterium]|nr:chemotaxis protein CheV [Syntrophobacteraceae bacterium]
MAQQTNILLAAGTNEMEIVEFYLDELTGDGSTYRGSYGINVAKVVGIIQKPDVTTVPMAPFGMLGTFISRNKVIPLVDLAMRLGKQRPSEGIHSLAIVTEVNNATMAYVVSGVNRIHRLAWGQIEPAGTILGTSESSVTGIVKIEDRNVLILDMERLLSELNPDLAMKEEIAETKVEPGARHTALIVDDSFSIRNILVNNLENAGFNVTTASDGREAWRWLEELKDRSQREGRPIDAYLQVVISDIEMPQMDGYSLCQSIKRDSLLQTLPVILFSSLIQEKQRHKGFSVGADAQITKPET